MVDMAVIGGALTGIKTAVSIVRSLTDLKESVAVNSKAAELLGVIADIQGTLLEAQLAMGEMQEELRQAKVELARRADLNRYELVEPYPGTRIYRLKKDAQKDGEPMHYICPQCKDIRGDLSILQGDEEYVACNNTKVCGHTFQLAATQPMKPRRRVDF